MSYCSLIVLNLASLTAVLPPLWQSVDEIKSLLSDPDLDKYLTSADYIESITRNEDGFRIVTNKHVLDAHIKYLPQTMPGPAHFSWTFSLEMQESSKQ